MKSIAALVAVGLVVLSTGCGRYRNAAVAQARYCRDNPGAVELFLDGAPSRPYRVVGVVDSPSNTRPGRVKKLQIAACRLGADAIVDDWRGDDVPVAERGVRMRGLAIQYTDVAGEAQQTTVAAPIVIEDGDDEGGGPIQIQASGVEIHAPSVEVRRSPPQSGANGWFED